ncbi:MAG: hypothetical protein RL536_583, partial [Candidatus Parcubacteria bacterium]
MASAIIPNMSNKSLIYLTGFSICLLVSIVFFTENVLAAGFIFDRPLQIGSSGEDVRELQKVLNSDVNTQISRAGNGSPGLETTYFGSLTKAAVIKFQEKYSEDILLPNGLIAGTGFVGKSTLSILNKLSQELAGDLNYPNYSLPKSAEVPKVTPTSR